MHSMRQRGADIVASAVSAFLIMALLTAATTVVRDLVLRPRPRVFDVRVSGLSPLYHVRTFSFLSPTSRDASLYYVPDGKNAPAVVLPSNIEVLDLVDREADTEEEKRRKAWQRQRVPPGYELGVRTTDRVAIYLSGSIDFADLWDWNTKAIYISFVARFKSATTTHNEVVFLDAVMRPATPPKSLMRLIELRRQERAERRQLGLSPFLPSSSNSEKGLVTHGVVQQRLSETERQQLTAYEASLRNAEHDHPSLYVDHVDKLIFMNESNKYFVDAFDVGSLAGNVVEVVLRYQVMSYSGWAPVREEVLGHQLQAQMPAVAVLWDPQRRVV